MAFSGGSTILATCIRKASCHFQRGVKRLTCKLPHVFRSKSDHNSGSQSSLPKDAKKRREGVLECSSSTRLERGRKEGMQEGFSMPQSYKKRKEGVQEGVAQPDVMGSSTSLIPKSMDG